MTLSPYIPIFVGTFFEVAVSDIAFEKRFVNHFTIHNVQPTEDQMEICRQVADIHSHFTEEELRKNVRAQRPEMSLGTVKSTLREMFRAGLVRQIVFDKEDVFYEHVFGHVHHDHLWCLECHKVVEFSDSRIEDIEQRIAQKNDFLIMRHQLQLVGLCNQCKDKASKYALKEREVKTKQVMPLAMALDGTIMTISNLVGGRGMRRRLSELGLMPGENVKVVSNRFAGPFIIEVKGTRLVIAHKLAHHILVSEA